MGFRVLYKHDRTRKWLPSKSHLNRAAADQGRPIRINVWYPAVPAKGAESMRYGDYFHYEGDDNFRGLNNELEKYDRGSWLEDLNEVSPNGTEIFCEALRYSRGCNP